MPGTMAGGTLLCFRKYLYMHAFIELCLCEVHMHVHFFNMNMQFCNICVQCLLNCKAYASAMITNSQSHVRAIIAFMCVKNVCACNK
jgi:hypothetical protein